MARRKKGDASGLKLDSFSDIITNVLGILIFLGVMFSLTSSGAKFIVRTPRVQDTKRKPVFFECRKGQLFFVDKDGIWSDLDRKVTRLLKYDPDMALGEISSRLAGEQIGNPYYLLDQNKFFEENLISLMPREGVKGETIKDLQKPDSTFHEIIQNLHAGEDFVYFFVKPDSFEIFRIARSYVWDKDFHVGWHPLDYGRYPTFGSRGRRPKKS